MQLVYIILILVILSGIIHLWFPSHRMENDVAEAKNKRGLGGQIAFFAFVSFNIVMFLWLCSYWIDVSTGYQGLSEAGQAGKNIGVMLGTLTLLLGWAVGDIILGLFVFLTKPER